MANSCLCAAVLLSLHCDPIRRDVVVQFMYNNDIRGPRSLVGESKTLNVVYLAQNEADCKDLLFNKMVLQTSW